MFSAEANRILQPMCKPELKLLFTQNLAERDDKAPIRHYGANSMNIHTDLLHYLRYKRMASTSTSYDHGECKHYIDGADKPASSKSGSQDLDTEQARQEIGDETRVGV